MNFQKFSRTFYDDVIYKDDSYIWPNKGSDYYSSRPEVNVGHILKLFGSRMVSRKLLKVWGIPESLPTALELRNYHHKQIEFGVIL